MSRSHLSAPDPEWTALQHKLPPPHPADADGVVIREAFAKHVIPHIQSIYQKRLPPDSDYKVEDRTIPVDGGEITLRCLTPTPANADSVSTYPLLYWMHGGGWYHGNIHMDDYTLRILCVEFQISIVNVEYRLAPEYPFPISLEDCYAGLKWAADNASVLSASLAKGFIIGGLSAGGNLTAVIAHRTRDDPFFANKKITGQLLMIPAVVHPDGVPEEYKSELTSVEENQDAPAFNRSDLYKCYSILGADPKDPRCSPLLYPSHANLPPAYLQVCGMDPLRDEGLLYEKVLREAGVKTRIDVYPGVPHGFHWAFGHISQALKYDQDTKYGLRWLLSQSALSVKSPL
ncbi:hypothetical protein OBBRIDRAFT_792947 [Obba rivulosa]|uniref:Alpha/beta hydrolase fold-3 domain-containing protein n=1 Tax=Obba rivulosa TaxID=1052685 RepID=A0A8E2ATL6_9APHY|nr:hypothetical protein OBBRIDRAFT_792947 [Obba rivulosa]